MQVRWLVIMIQNTLLAVGDYINVRTYYDMEDCANINHPCAANQKFSVCMGNLINAAR